MKKETKTKNKTTKKVTKIVPDYKAMYASMKVLADNLSKELDRKSDLAFEQAAVIFELEDRVKEEKFNTVLWSFSAVLVGVAIGYFF